MGARPARARHAVAGRAPVPARRRPVLHDGGRRPRLVGPRSRAGWVAGRQRGRSLRSRGAVRRRHGRGGPHLCTARHQHRGAGPGRVPADVRHGSGRLAHLGADDRQHGSRRALARPRHVLLGRRGAAGVLHRSAGRRRARRSGRVLGNVRGVRRDHAVRPDSVPGGSSRPSRWRPLRATDHSVVGIAARHCACTAACSCWPARARRS